MRTLNDIVEAWKRRTGGRQYPVLTKQPRRIGIGEHLLNRIHHGLTIMVCDTCEDERTLKNRGYVELRRFHAEAKCDGCQEYQSVAMWLFDDHPWHIDLKQGPRLNQVRRRDRETAERFRYARGGSSHGVPR